ncbi:MAG TPA: cyclopropane-fatty-acyl-phospholipid synthase family protein [Mariprofundaceae bacterium]|nr:cyclopropane-fatty-acyl-phospholipid synthase family protein [Mariprofundaceae bacterium]
MFLEKRLHAFANRLMGHDVPLRIRLWNGAEMNLGSKPRVTIAAPSMRGLQHLLNPTLGKLGEAYVEGHLDVEGPVMDVVHVVAELTEKAFDANKPMRSGLRLAKHSKKQDADAIAYHYDLSNEFYAEWLDPEMVYSCAYFRNEDDSLEKAQEQKMDHILRKMRVGKGHTLLDIGCGWGALVMRAAERYGAKAVGVTLSQNQYDLANERIRARGLQDRCEVRLEDYRDVSGRFDRIVSVGMFEHVGLKNLREYFDKVRKLLTSDGITLIHGITSTDPDSRQSPWDAGDFIGRYVFPHGELPHISLALQEMCAAGLEPLDVENLRRHYAMTLQHWAERFEAASEKIRSMVDEKSYRIWRVYLAGCSYGFLHNWVAIHQMLAINPQGGAHSMPLTRDYMYR